jgi:hypothetical protein
VKTPIGQKSYLLPGGDLQRVVVPAFASAIKLVYNSGMVEGAGFIPGRPGVSGGPLARYRPTQPVHAVEAYVRDLTQPGDLVVDLFCQGPTIVREAVAAGRRALGLSVNPLLLAIARLGLSRRDAGAINAASTRLADSPKGDVPLRRHLLSLYASACPTCGASGIAEWFAWDRDGSYPFRKAVRCPSCEAVQEGTPDDEDVASAERTSSRGLAYYYALDRVAPPGHPARERAAELVELYTPRNLSTLMDLTMRLEGLEAGEETRLALTGVLLDCFDAGSSLDPYEEERPRPRTLRVPSLYFERNVWLCFEEGISKLLAEEPPLSVPRVTEAADLVNGEAEGYALASHAARDVRKVIQPRSAALIVTDPPRPDAVFWALSALWAGWLWESPAARRLRPFLRRRRFDWDWHWRVLQSALEAAGPMLASQGYLLTLFSDADGTLLESVCLAASGAGYTLEGWGYSPEVGHRMAWRWELTEVGEAPDVVALDRALRAVAEGAGLTILRERGEPTIRSLLHAGACAELVAQGLLRRAVAIPKDGPSVFSFVADAIGRSFDEVTSVVQLVSQEEAQGDLWWLADPGQVADALADQVEAHVWELLVQQKSWKLEELINAVYARLSGPLTPELPLVLVCIESFSVQEGEELHLRPEDDPLQRAAELKTLRSDLVDLGKRLGFKAKRRGGWDVRWLEAGEEAYVFDVSSTANLAHHLLARRRVGEGVQRCLVLPGGRAHLATFKLQRDPRLAVSVEADGWQFIKFRHLRRLVAKEELDHHALKTVLGLDPIAEQEAAQIPLF